MTVATEPVRINNADQHRILAAFAGGADINAMVDTMGMSRDYVSGIVARLSGFNRNTARTLVAEYDRRRAANQGIPATPAKATAPAAPHPQPPPSKAAPAAVKSASIDGLLHAASRVTTPRVTTLAARIRQLADELAQILDRAEEEEAARAAVAAKRRELDEAEAKLRALTGKPARQPHSAPGDLNRTVRAWAHANNVECPSVGAHPRPRA
jgi:hypothetical protein